MQDFQVSFLARVISAARESQQQFGVPASITIAQAILESGWGQSRLAVEANNYFGVKAAPGEPYSTFQTAEIVNGQRVMQSANFARYADADGSFLAHGRLLSVPRYAPAMKQKTDPRLFATALRSCGYSTAPNYEDMLMQLVNEYKLTQYDAVPL